MRNPISNRIASIAPSGIRRFFEYASSMPEVISLGVGEPDFDTPWSVRSAGIDSLRKGRTFYTANAGLLELRQEIQAYIARRYGIDYAPESEIIVTVGGSEALDIALRTMIDPGDEVIYLDPCFVSYVPCIVMAGGIPVPVQLDAKDSFKLTKEKLEAAITPKTKILLISYPNNPTGAVMTKEELMPIAETVKAHDLFVITDEIYSELSYTHSHVSLAAFNGMKERTVLINGFSKSYAMTGWRLGYAMAPKVIMEQMIKMHQFAIMSSPTTSQFAAIEALRNCDQDIERMREEYNMRRQFVYHALKRMDIPCFEPEGAFYMFPNISKFHLTSEEFAMNFLKEKQIAAVPGSAFGQCGEGHLRMSYASSMDDLKTAMERLEDFIQTL